MFTHKFLTTALAAAGLLLSSIGFAQDEVEPIVIAVSNGDNEHGLYTNDVFYNPQCDDAQDKKCKPRENFFGFSPDSALTVPLVDDAIPSQGLDEDVLLLNATVTAANGIDQSFTINLTFSGKRECDATIDSLTWRNSWGKIDQWLSSTTWQCYPEISGNIVDDYGTDIEVAQGVLSAPLQVGLGANAVDQSVVGAYVKFNALVNGEVDSKTWELVMTLDAESSTGFQIVFCPADDSTDGGDGSDPTTGGKDCIVDWFGDASFTSEIIGDEPTIRGTVDASTVEDTYDLPDGIVDVRFACGCTSRKRNSPCKVDNYEFLQTVSTSTGEELWVNLPEGLAIIPPELCGQLNADGIPVFQSLIVQTNFQVEVFDKVTMTDVLVNTGVQNSIVEHLAEDCDPATDADCEYYMCDVRNGDCDYGEFLPRQRQPVGAWVPLADRYSEVPLKPFADGTPFPAPSNYSLAATREVLDITVGEGSGRFSSKAWSELYYDLVYREDLTPEEMHAVIREDIRGLEAVVGECGACIDPNTEQSVLSRMYPFPSNGTSQLIEQTVAAFDAYDYPSVVSNLTEILEYLTGQAQPAQKDLSNSFLYCFYDPTIEPDGGLLPYATAVSLAVIADPDGNGVDDILAPAPYLPRNCRGDMEARVQNILFNIANKGPLPPPPSL